MLKINQTHFILFGGLLLGFASVSSAQNISDIPTWLQEMPSDDASTAGDQSLTPLLDTFRRGSDVDVKNLAREIKAQALYLEEILTIATSYDRVGLLRVPGEERSSLKYSGEREYLQLAFRLANLHRKHDSGFYPGTNRQLLRDLNRSSLRRMARRLEESFGWQLRSEFMIDPETVPSSNIFPTLLFPEPDGKWILIRGKDALNLASTDRSMDAIVTGNVLTVDQARDLRRELVKELSKFVDRLITLYQALISRIASDAEIRFEPDEEKRIRGNLDYLYDQKVNLIDRALGSDGDFFRLVHARVTGAALARGFHVYQEASEGILKDRLIEDHLLPAIKHICWLLKDVYGRNEERAFLLSFFSGNQGDLETVKLMLNAFSLLIRIVEREATPENPSMQIAESFDDYLERSDRYTGVTDIGSLAYPFGKALMDAQGAPGIYSPTETWAILSTTSGAGLSTKILGVDLLLLSKVYDTQIATARLLQLPIR